MRTMRVRSAGPLISKLRKRELARKRSRVSSIISDCDESAGKYVNLERCSQGGIAFAFTGGCGASDSGFDR